MQKKGPSRRRKSPKKKREEVRYLRERSCKSKVRYESAHIARREANRFIMRYYSCDFCGGWHLTKRLF